MPSRSYSNLIAFSVAFLLYGGTLLVIMSYLVSQQERIERFTSKKDDFLDIVLVTREDSANQKKPLVKKPSSAPITKQEISPESPKKKSETSQQASPKPLASVKDLFRGVDALTMEEPLDIPKPSPKTQSRLKPEKSQKEPPVKTSSTASKLVSSLEFEEASKSQSTGTYDPFKGKISELLEGYWQQTIDTVSGAEATVDIRVDDTGSFSYSIVSLSYNNTFNAKLRDFLERMKSVPFPPYTGDGIMRMNIKFKDIME